MERRAAHVALAAVAGVARPPPSWCTRRRRRCRCSGLASAAVALARALAGGNPEALRRPAPRRRSISRGPPTTRRHGTAGNLTTRSGAGQPIPALGLPRGPSWSPGPFRTRTSPCAESSASSATPRRATSPTSASTRSSTAGRSRRASSPATASGSTRTAAWASCRPASRRRTSAALPGDRAIGHVRYSTAGGSHLRNAQPFAVEYARGSLAVAHNGNLTNHEALRERLEVRGSIFQSASDTEAIVHLIAMSNQRGVEGRIAEALAQVEGAYSHPLPHRARAHRRARPHGHPPARPRPPGAARRQEGASSSPASPPPSTSSAPSSSATSRPGEMIIADEGGLARASFPFDPAPRKMCLFEYVYFARPDSTLEGASVYEVRKALGRRLARGAARPARRRRGGDPRPRLGRARRPSASPRRRGVPFEMGLIRSHYVGRTFIEPQQSIRHFGVRLKLSPNRAVLEGKRVVVVDDSIVRGTTSRKIVSMIRDAGARGGPRPHLEPPARLALLLRHRHAHPRRAHRRRATPSRRSAPSSAPTRWATCRSRGWWSRCAPSRAAGGAAAVAGRCVLPRVLLGAVPDRRPAAPRAAPAPRERVKGRGRPPSARGRGSPRRGG